jgi:hypothetical protein
MFKATVLSQAEAKGSTRNMLPSHGFGYRQHYQFLTSAFLLKTVFLEGISKNKGYRHQFRIISFL